MSESKIGQLESINEEGSGDLVDGPDTSSFSAFLYSLLLSSETEDKSTSDEQKNDEVESGDLQSDNVMKESGGKKSFFSRGKQSVCRAMYKAARMGGYTIILWVLGAFEAVELKSYNAILDPPIYQKSLAIVEAKL